MVTGVALHCKRENMQLVIENNDPFLEKPIDEAYLEAVKAVSGAKGKATKGNSSVALGFDLHEHLRVGGEALQEGEQALDGFDRFVTGESAADEGDFCQLVRREEKFFAARS